MSKFFQTRTCPLCSKKLTVGDEDSVHDFYCEDFYLRHYDYQNEWLLSLDDKYSVRGFYRMSKIKEPHYSIKFVDGKHIQSTIIPPYWVISTETDEKTRIYKFGSDINPPSPQTLLMEVPIIVPSDYLPEQFAKKIKNLVIFS